jgi:predicted esterase
MNAIARATVALVCSVASAAPLTGQAGTATDVRLESVDHGRYFLLDALDGEQAPESGHGLLVVLPGGDGDDSFLPFVQQTVLAAAPSGFVGAMVTAIRWTEDQQIVWPTARTPALDMLVSTEDYVSAVVEDVSRRRRIDPNRILLLAWSSSGPAAYEIASREQQPFQGFYIAMSVFWRDDNGLRHVAGRRFALDQSSADEVTPFRFAARAYASLTAQGANVWLRRYQGGHGWHDSPALRLREGFEWLLVDTDAPTVPADVAATRQPLQNGSFELGTAGWHVIDHSGALHAEIVEGNAPDGRRALRLVKSRHESPDVVRQEVALPDAARIRVSARVRTNGAEDSSLRFRLYDADGRPTNEDERIVRLSGDRGWREVTGIFDVGDADAYGVFEIVIGTNGELWVDDVRIATVQPSGSLLDPVR